MTRVNDKRSVIRDVASESDTKAKKNRNVIPKILCVLAAFVLWIYVMQVESPEYTETFRSVPVTLENVSALKTDAGLSVYSGSGSVVNVTVSGKKSVINKLTDDDIKAFADVGKIKESGRNSVEVSVDVPDGLSLSEISPATVTVFADKTDTVSLNVKEKLDKMVLSSPYELGKLEFEFDSISVSGPRSILDKLTGAQVVVDMDGKQSTFTANCPIVLIDENGDAADTTYLNLSAGEMNVKVPIYVTKDVEIPVSFKYGALSDDLVDVTVTPASLTVKGDGTLFTDGAEIIDPIVIDEKAITTSPYVMTVHPTVNGKFTVDSENEDVTVTVTLDPSLVTKQFNVTDISVINAPKDLKYEIADKSVSVTLRGTEEQLSKIKASDISAVVDLEGYDSETTGTVSKTAVIGIDSKQTFGVFEIGEYNVHIKINQ